jgi:acyl-CoA dehydrogenase
MAVLYEAMNYSIFGPVAFNCAAPDDGNMYILNKVANQAQKDRWLTPIINGDVRSSFAMTEPAPWWRFGPEHDPNNGKAGEWQMGHQWPQMVYYRRWRGGAFYFDGQNRRWRA